MTEIPLLGLGVHKTPDDPMEIKLRLIPKGGKPPVEYRLSSTQSRALVTAILSHYAAVGNERAFVTLQFLCGKIGAQQQGG